MEILQLQRHHGHGWGIQAAGQTLSQVVNYFSRTEPNHMLHVLQHYDGFKIIKPCFKIIMSVGNPELIVVNMEAFSITNMCEVCLFTVSLPQIFKVYPSSLHLMYNLLIICNG